MQSTSISDSRQEVLVSCKDLNLVFQTKLYHMRSLRDVFVQTLKDPLKAIAKQPDRLHVLQGVNLEVYKGDRLGILGVNGVGKTSLCRCIAGVYQPTSGQVQVKGQVRGVFDVSVGIFPELTGRENAYLLAHLMYPELDHNEINLLVEDALKFSELDSFLDAPFKIYSNGMQARLSLSIISSRPTDLLIMDEVFEGADRFFKDKIAARIVNMIEKSGAVLFVSHSPDQVLRVCNRALVLNRGKIVFDGSPQEAQKFYLEMDPTQGQFSSLSES